MHRQVPLHKDAPAATNATAADDEDLLRPGGGLASGWRVVLVSVMAMIVGPPPVLILGFGLFIPEFQASFGWSVQAISLGATLISLMLVVVAPLQGFLTDRLGCRWLNLLSIPLFGLGVLCLSRLGSNISLYYLACVVLPFAGIGLWPLTYMKLTSTWFDRRLGLALGCLNLGNGLGGALVPLVLGVVFSFYGWRTAYVLLGMANLLIAWPIAAIWLRERPVSAAKPGAESPEFDFGLTFGEALRTASFPIIALGFFVIGVLSTAFLVHQFNILVEAGLSKRSATMLQSYLGFSSIIGQLAAGWLMDRIAAGRVVAGMLGLIALACLIYTTSLAGPLALPSVTVVGLMIGAEMNILGFMIKRYFGERAFGRLYGLIFACFSCGGALGAQILAWSRTGLHSYTPGLAIVALLCLVVGTLFLRLGPYRFVMSTPVGLPAN